MECGPSPIVHKAYFNQWYGYYGDKIEYFCPTGYWFEVGVTHMMSSCQSNQQWSYVPGCKCKICFAVHVYLHINVALE